MAPPYSLLFDSRIFATANLNSVSRGGIYRYASQLLVGLTRYGGKDGWPNSICPYCSDPFLAVFSSRDLNELQERFGVHLNPPVPVGGGLSQFYTPPPVLKRLLKPIYNRLIKTNLVANGAEKQLRKIIQDLGGQNIVYHTPFQPVSNCFRTVGIRNVVVTVHDLLPRIRPDYFTHETIQTFNDLIDHLRPSDHVICVSESTRNDFLSLVSKIPSSQVHVTPLAADPRLRPVIDPSRLLQLREHLGLDLHDQVVLSLCTLEPRKNLITLVEAFSRLVKVADGSSIKLVLVGSLGWKTSSLMESIRESSVRDQIIVTGYIDDAWLSDFYSLADVFVYPSLYEGFGLPPLEAMQCGCCVIAGHTSSLPEVVGDSGILVDPRSHHELQEAMAAMLGSPSKREVARSSGIKQAEKFSWQNTAQLTASVYERVITSSVSW